MEPEIKQYPIFEKGSSSAQYQQISNFCVNYLEGLLVNLMHMELPEQLQSDQSAYEAIQQELLKRERTVRHAFQFQTEKLFSDFKSIRRTRLRANRSSDWLSLGLTGHNSSKLNKSIENINAKYQLRFDQPLLTQSKRLKTLVHRSDDAQDDNPISPLSLCNAFVASIEALKLTTNKSCQLLELFDVILDDQLQNFYVEIDLGLYYLDILPHLTDPALFKEPVEEVVSDNPSETLTAAEPQQDSGVVLQISTHLHKSKKLHGKKEKARKLIPKQLKSFRQATQSGTFEHEMEFEQLIENIGELMLGNTLSDLQKFSQFYNRLLDNPLLNAPLRLQLSRLSYPLVELVLVDPFFFRSSSHPVNDFIQSVVDFEIRYQHRDQSLSQLTSLIDQLLLIKRPALCDFQPLTSAYEDFKQIETERIKQKKKQQQVAEETLKNDILELVNDITKTLIVETETMSFFYEDWHLLLLQLARKIGPDSNEFNQAIEIARMLAWSLDENREDNTQYKKQSFTHLLKAIDKGLNAVNFSNEHRHRVRKQLVKDFKNNNDNTQVSIFDSQATHSSDSVTQFSTTITRKSSQLTDIKIRSASVQSNAASTLTAMDVTVGSWVEIKLDKQKKAKRAKLKWKSANNNQFIFVDQRGHKIKESNQAELDEELVNGIIILLKAPSLAGKTKSSLGSGFHCFSK